MNKRMLKETATNDIYKPLLSVIVPVYNTEDYLPKCLDSIINQTYSRLEIIVVNDCSPGDTKTIVQEYMKKDSRIKYVEHEKNRGLFHARITGSEKATGQYIAFVDSDDYISIDYYRLLVNKAIKEKADIVEGRIIREHENGERFIQNLNNILHEELIGKEIADEFFSQEGLFYHWHVIWNKIYSKELWDKCLPYYKKQTKHLIMTEDLAFSSLLFCNAKKYCSIKYEGYFYLIRAEASTGSASDLNKFLKNIRDMGTAFDFVEAYLKATGRHKMYGRNLTSWKKRYFRLWAARLKSTEMPLLSRNQAIRELKNALNIEDIEPVQPEDYYHSIINTPWDHRYESLKKMIAHDDVEYVSFDIFDTLIVRPFFDPRDLLGLLNDYFHEIYPDAELLEFSSLRMQAEEQVRQQIKYQKPSWQDVNLDEIYDYIKREYKLSSEITERLKAKEIELEIQFTQRRESIFELFEMAKVLKKKVILVSDMYLPKKVIEEIVQKSGYRDYENLYVSSEVRLLKHTGDMYKYVVNDLGIEPNKILHIGDNWKSDKIMAERFGLKACFTAKTTDLLLNTLADKETGTSLKYFNEYRPNKWEKEHPKYFSTRCMLANVANKIFDNPYPSFNPDTDFNADPYFVGYYALGMHTFALTKWMIEDAIQNKYGTVHFVARDGYLPYKIFGILSKCYPEAPSGNYIYASRKSLLPSLFFSNNEYGLASFMSIYAQSPESVMGLLKGILKDNIDMDKLKKQGVILSKNFSSQYEFKKFVDIINEEAIDREKVKQYIDNLKEYFNSQIESNDATFDLGYSGRLQTIIVKLIKRRCDAYFVHTNRELPWIYAKRNGFRLKSFYDFTPSISGILREHLFAELGPSCIGYKRNNDGDVEPIFENYYSNYINKLMIKTIQKASVEFAVDMKKNFKNYVPEMKINKEVSLPLEMFIHNSKQGDRSLFMHSYSDDAVHGGSSRNSIIDWWNTESEKIYNNRFDKPSTNLFHTPSNYFFLQNRNRMLKFIFYSLFDRDTLKEKVKTRYRNKPFMIKMLTISYGSLRKVKRIFFK